MNMVELKMKRDVLASCRPEMIAFEGRRLRLVPVRLAEQVRGLAVMPVTSGFDLPKAPRVEGSGDFVRDLFGEVPITWEEVHAWVFAVAGMTPDNFRVAGYLRGWNVLEKIARAKLAGTFEEVLEADDRRR